jgi:pilus assembly protein CpaB
MSPRQIITLGIALLAALGALFMVRGMAGRGEKEVAAPVVAVQGPRVLVAAKDIGAGATLQPTDMEWRVWAETGLSPNFIKDSDGSGTLEELSGAVARQDLVAGEPIVRTRAIKPGEQGFMAAILTPGYRAVAVPISEEAAAAGYIMPNDRVDVIVTRKVTLLDALGGSGEESRSGIALENVRVLAIDSTYKAEKGEEPKTIEGSVALLELSPRDVEALSLADQMDEISLALRPIANQQVASVQNARRSTPAMEQNPARVWSKCACMPAALPRTSNRLRREARNDPI